jgi:hypothetical protein
MRRTFQQVIPIALCFALVAAGCTERESSSDALSDSAHAAEITG